MKKTIQLILELDTDNDVSIDSIKKDLMQEISCASYYYKLKSCKEINIKDIYN